jgi:DNA-directed RNA polymerase specialized sigma24 family protein
MVRMTPELISRARAGDRDAFRELTEPHRRELRVHCYRMLGSFQEAEDVLQDTLLAAWQGMASFEERASLRTWLYRIATHRCLNARRSASRLLGFEAREVAEMLDSTLDSVQSALKRARANLEGRRSAAPLAASPSPAEEAVATRFARAYQAADLDALVALLTDDVLVSMPPLPLEYRGRDAARRFFGPIFRAGRRLDLLPTRANGQPAFGAYLRTASGPHPAVGLFVIAIRGEEICAMTRFEPSVLGWFGLPPSLG